jgi:hypothetical protein
MAGAPVPPVDVSGQPPALDHTDSAALAADGDELRRLGNDAEAHALAARVADELRELIVDLVVRGDVAGLETVLGGVRALASVRAVVDVAKRRAGA